MNFFILFESIVLIQILLISLYDLKTGKIKNSFLLFLLITQIIYGYLIGYEANWETMYGILAIVLISFFFWFVDLIPSGDSKFLVVSSIHLFFLNNYNEVTTVWIFLLATFVPFSISYLFLGILRAIKRNREIIKEAFLQSFNFYNVFMLAIVFIGITGFATDFLSYFIVLQKLGVLSWIIIILLMLFFSETLMKISPINLEYIYVLLAGIRILLLKDIIFSLEFLIDMTFLVFSYIFFRFFVLKISYELETVEIPIEKLKPGMRLAEVIIKEGKTYKKVRSERYSLSDYLKGKFLKAIHSTSEEGLSKYEVRKLKKLKKENKLTFETIRVYKVIPFGIFIFIGNLLVLLFIFSGFKIY